MTTSTDVPVVRRLAGLVLVLLGLAVGLWLYRDLAGESILGEYTHVGARGVRQRLVFAAVAVLSGGVLLLGGRTTVTLAAGAAAAAAPLPEDLAAELAALVASGRKIEAIKLYREATGGGLADAKHAVEQLGARERGLTRFGTSTEG